MAEKDDLLGANTEQGEEEEPLSAEKIATDTLMDATVDDCADSLADGKEPDSASEDIAGQGVATGEVRVVEDAQKKSNSTLLLAVLLLVLLLGGGFYLLDGDTSSQTEHAQKSPVKRYVIDKKIAEEVIESQSVSAVASVIVPAPAKLAEDVAKAVVVAETNAVKKAVAAPPVKDTPASKPVPLYRVLVGPFLYVTDLKTATEQLKSLGYKTEITKGRGKVSMIRLREGIYPAAEGRSRLVSVKQQVKDAFLLPAGDKLAIYVGSFTDRNRAEKYSKKLAGKGVEATLVASEIEMNGKMLIVIEADQQAARKVAAKIVTAGFKVQIARNNN